MSFVGNPDKIIRLIKALYKKSQSAVRVNGDITDWFATTVGVRQGCVLSPQLFNILLELVMLYAMEDVNVGASINGYIINNLRFADDIVLMAETAKELQMMVNRVHQSCSKFGLKINIGKTEIQVINKHPINLKIAINGHQLNQVEEFTYLGGTISQQGQCSPDIKHRIGKALGAMQMLANIWRSKEISNATKIELYRVLILSILLYGAETWTIKKEDENRLLTFEMTCLRKILGVSRLDKIRNDTIRQSLGISTTIIDRVTKKRLRFFGHINRMITTRYPKIVFGSYTHGDRPRGRPAKRWDDCLKPDLKSRGIETLAEGTRIAQDRKIWQGFVEQKPSHRP